ncbi:MAG: hypothetical protein Q9168_001898 [Polycauliona sp. 1 TL-2023]
MADNPYPHRIRIRDVVATVLITVFLIAQHLSCFKGTWFGREGFWLQVSENSPKEERFGSPRGPLVFNELETKSNTNTDDILNPITAQVALTEHHVNSSSGHGHAKRVDVMSYPYAVCKGRLMWTQIQNAFNGQRPPGAQFGQADFDDAWALNPEPESFSFNQLPDPQLIFRRVAVQSKAFKNLAGRQVVTPTGGRHDILYVPGWSAMLATNVQSPSARLADSDDSPYGHAVDEKDIPPLIPPMNRLSDISWYVWSQLAPYPERLRYIGHDFIVTGDTTSIMEYLTIARFGDDEIDLPWPGLFYDIDTDEAKALLVVPNSLATAYIMLDHAATLGRRRPRVHIFKNNRGVWCMLWDLVPA